MKLGRIKHVVFDVGNVIVRWAPLEITRLTLGDAKASEQWARSIFGSEIWVNLDKGVLSEAQAKREYQVKVGLSAEECERLFYYVKHTQLLIYGSVDVLKRVKAAGYGVYALTNNVHETVAYLKSTYTFWDVFNGVTVSADLGLLKPEPEIYQAMLAQHGIKASEAVFIDDMPHNVEGAKAVGLSAIQFESAAQCEQALNVLGVVF